MAIVKLSNTSDPAGQVGKVAAVTASFWILKIVATTVGDLAGDMLATTLHLGYIVGLLVALVIMLTLVLAQIKALRFHPAMYWFSILVSSTIGAEISDSISRTLHLGYAVGAAILAAGLLAALVVWRISCGKIRVYPIYEQRDELFYWTTVVFANSLGSVIGDFFSDQLGLGLLGSFGINAGIMIILWVLHYASRANKNPLFWIAFVFSRL